MAFYPDELSPIDRIRSLGQPADALPDIGSLKNRRQWKSLVLGKKDMGINNFATITEEKEEEISSDGSQGANSNKGSVGGVAVNAGVVAHKKITFPKPRKYITSRVSDRKDEASLRGNTVSFAPLSSPLKDYPSSGTEGKKGDIPSLSTSPKSSVSEMKQLPKIKKSREAIAPAQEFTENYVLTETPIEVQWKEAVSDGPSLMSWSRPNADKVSVSKHDGAQGPKNKQEEKRKSSTNPKVPAPADAVKKEAKAVKKKGSSVIKKTPKAKEESPPSKAEKVSGIKTKQKPEKGKTLNMKEVVNVYKNLAYGSKEEIKSFIENLSFVKDESKAENDKNLLSMMNLKALENKLKSFAKKSGKGQEASTSQEKKGKLERPLKKSRKAHIERLARHKVVKVPAVLNNNYLKPSGESTSSEKATELRGKRASSKDKEPWKYVGMESVLDKTYFVYPAYPPSVNLKKATKGRKMCAKGTEKPSKEKKENADEGARKVSEAESKVKSPQVVLRPNSFAGGGMRSHGLNVSRSLSNKSMSRPSATTVCTVEFRPAVGQKAEEPPVGATDQSLLVYLHGTKAINVKSPYSDKQFSRVKFFRKDERGMPLIKGLGCRAVPRDGQNVSVRNISLPGKLNRVRSLDLLDFDEDIENITEFLRSQDTPERQHPEEWQGVKKSERDWWQKESPKEVGPVAPRHQRRHRRTIHELHHHQHHHHHLNHFHPHHSQHGTSQETPISPDSIIAEISNNIQHLQYLPDTEDNRKLIAHFFDELDQRIEASRKGTLTLEKLPSTLGVESFRPIPILGY